MRGNKIRIKQESDQEELPKKERPRNERRGRIGRRKKKDKLEKEI